MATPVEPVTARDAVAVTPSDTTDFSAGNGRIPSALYVGVLGDVTVVTEGGTSVLFTDVAAGSIIPLRVKKVMDTGTDSDLNIVALFY